jgi:hypothetical protein
MDSAARKINVTFSKSDSIKILLSETVVVLTSIPAGQFTIVRHARTNNHGCGMLKQHGIHGMRMSRRRMRLFRRGLLLVAALIGMLLVLPGCGAQTAPVDPAVPLADDQPTFLFFFVNP